MKQIIIIAILAFGILALLAPAQAFAISNKPTQLIDNCGLGQNKSCISTVAANGTIIIIPGTPPPAPVQQPLRTEVVEDATTDEGDSSEVPGRSSGSNYNDNNDNGNDGDGDGGRYVGECKGQAAPDYPDYCSDPKDLPEDSGFNDDDKTAFCGGEPCTPTEKEDSWVDDPMDRYVEDLPPCNEVSVYEECADTDYDPPGDEEE